MDLGDIIGILMAIIFILAIGGMLVNEITGTEYSYETVCHDRDGLVINNVTCTKIIMCGGYLAFNSKLWEDDICEEFG